MRAEVREIVAAIQPADALESAHRADTLAWVDSGAPLWRTEKPATPPRHLVSYCAVCDAIERHLLLVDHADAGLWLPAGGHVEPGEHPRDAAAREAREELGIAAALVFPQPLFLTVTETVGHTAGHTDVSLWYVLAGDVRQQFLPDSREFSGAAWFPLDRLPLERSDPHLGRFAAKLAAALQQ